MTNRFTFSSTFRSHRNRTSRFLLLSLAAFLAVIVFTAAPRQLAAQEAGQAVASRPESANKAATKEAETQEDQTEQFLIGGPIVQWTARHFDIDVRTAANIYQAVNFIVLALLIGVPILRVAPKIFRKRSQTLGHSLQTAREATQDANARLRAVEDKLAGLDDEIKKLRAQVEQESLEDEKRVKASLAEESARIVESTEQELNVAVAHARRGLRHFAADLAIEQAARQMTLTPEADRALIAEFIGSAGNNGAKSEGGQN